MVRFGVIGTNWITEEMLRAGQEVSSFQFTAVYSRTADRAAEFAQKFGVSTIFTDLTEMAQSEEVDAVYIASPNSLHAQQAITLMNHGKHVLCEKPMASNAREAKEMIEAARRNGVVFMEALKSTLLPNFAAIRENLPKIGEIRRYFASYCQYSSRYDAYKAGTVLNAFKPEFSNGALMDLGVYCLYPLVVLFGKPERISAHAMMLESGVDGEGSILLSYQGKDAVIMYSKITNSDLPAEIQGEQGTMVIDRISNPQHVQIRYRDGRVEDVSVAQEKHSMSYELAEFVGLIENRKQQSEINSHENSLVTLEIMDEARKQIGLVYPNDKPLSR
ncbi:Gfo/Idh/MocA family protein [Brevibacillus migulae]|uniref:Gfo/Idh/MocA family protein n=1 Tax=Brevibacillus migulae TaxID=1644114 RepID=UPI00106EB00F|nr:Gfo/Idh/MocA family oxidoreductase [Brevibacillus migulae]